MNLLILAVQFKGGSLQVVVSLINEFRNFTRNNYHIVLSKEVEIQIKPDTFPANFYFYSLPHFSKIRLLNFRKRAKWLTGIEKSANPSCVLSTSGPIYWQSNTPMLMGYNLGHYIYLESPFYDIISYYKKLKWWLKRVAHRYYFRVEADAYFVQTEDVNLRLKKFLNKDKVFTISNTYNDFYKHITKYENKLPPKNRNEIRLLTITTYYQHKNLDIIKPVLDELNRRNIDNVVFVLTLQPEFYNNIFEDKHVGKIYNIGFIKSIECPSLYNECDFMFLPTLIECFSASYAEAMVMKKPILTSDLGFAHTVCEDAALYFEPLNPIDIANKIELLINSPKLQTELVQKGNEQLKRFGTAEDRAKQILELCENINK